eukprot:746938-Hanusia_phi.AAC.5
MIGIDAPQRSSRWWITASSAIHSRKILREHAGHGLQRMGETPDLFNEAVASGKFCHEQSSYCKPFELQSFLYL